jgi:undecaprenyl-diphosphatase
MLVLFLALAIGATALIKLASEVAAGDTFALDKAIMRALRSGTDAAVPAGPGWIEAAMLDLTALGGVTVLTLIAILAVGYLVAVRKYASAAFVAVSTGSGAMMSSLLKDLFVRARPDVVPHLVEVSSASFPSAHAMNSALIYLTLATLLARGQQSRRVRIYLLSIAIALTLLIGISRVYLGVHWPSDVVAGWSVGAAWAVLCSLVGKSLQRNRKIEPATPTPEPAKAG